MADVSYDMAAIASRELKWLEQAVHRYIGGVEHKTWKPAAGKVKVKSGEFWPMIEAFPSRLVLSMGESRLTLYVRGTKQNPIIDGVDIIGTTEPFEEVFKAWGKQYQTVITEVGRKQAWNQQNPMYRTQNPNRTKVAKSKLNPSQLIAGS